MRTAFCRRESRILRLFSFLQAKKLQACRLTPFCKRKTDETHDFQLFTGGKPEPTLHFRLAGKSPGCVTAFPLLYREKPLKQAAFRLFLFQAV